MNNLRTGPLIRAVTQPNKAPLNILCMDTHERYQINLAATGHNFFSVKHPKHKFWEEKYGKKPANYTHVDYIHILSDFMHQMDIDVVLSQHKFGQYQFLSGVAQQLDLPLVSLEHTVPPVESFNSKIDKRSNMRGDLDIYLWDYSLKAWHRELDDSTRIIYHGFDTNYWNNYVDSEARVASPMTVVNDFINRDKECGYSLWQEVTKDMPRQVYGTTPGLSKTIDPSTLITEYNNHAIYINTSIVSSLPMSLIEAAACGCAIVTTQTCAIPEIFEHEKNCLMSNDPNKLREYINYLQDNREEAKRLGIEARKCIVEKLPLSKFVDNWNEAFHSAIRRHYEG